MNVGELKRKLDDFGDHVDVVMVADDDSQYNITSVEPVTTAGGGAGTGLYIERGF